MEDALTDLGYDPLLALEAKLARQIHDDAVERDRLWQSYWERRRMVTVPEAPAVARNPTVLYPSWKPTGTMEIGVPFATDQTPAEVDAMKQNPLIRPFELFPNLAPKGGIKQDRDMIYPVEGESFPNLTSKKKPIAHLMELAEHLPWTVTVRACIARLKSARAKESTNRNLSTLLAVVVKVQKDLETLVGEEVPADAVGGV